MTVYRIISPDPHRHAWIVLGAAGSEQNGFSLYRASRTTGRIVALVAEADGVVTLLATDHPDGDRVTISPGFDVAARGDR